jgi:hypothetical protein
MWRSAGRSPPPRSPRCSTLPLSGPAGNERSPAEHSVALEGCLLEPDAFLEGRPVESGVFLEGRPLEPGVFLEGRPVEHSIALKGRPEERGHVLEGRPVEHSTAVEGRSVEPDPHGRDMREVEVDQGSAGEVEADARPEG